MIEEIWKIVEDFPDYVVSNLGKVKRIIKDKCNRKIKILKAKIDKDGYLHINLYRNSKKSSKSIHRLVFETFNPIENMEKLQVNHINGIKNDNQLCNLEWCTCLENFKHAKRMGLTNRGENHYLFGKQLSEKTKKKISEKNRGKNSILTEKDVINIWKHINEGILTQKQIGEKFGVIPQTISMIKTGKNWKHIKGENMKKEERREIKKTLIDSDLYKFEGPIDNFIDLLLKAKEEAKREGFKVVTVDFGIGCHDDRGCCDFPYIEVEGARLETVEEAKMRAAAEEARKKREEQERYEALMEKYKDHD